MIRLRCFLFLRLAREKRDRWLTTPEQGFLVRHSEECDDCRARMKTSDESLDALAGALIEPEREWGPEPMANMVLPDLPPRRPYLTAFERF